ncbi:ATP-binding protein [Metamycoplasma alkalescens]|uniref:ATP-binding protein n=1 Tax=Metamycoplasma alkalescens TaxID=45363 RepID=UPI003A5C89BB
MWYFRKKDNFKKEIVTFLNSKGAEIYLGVHDDGATNEQQIRNKKKEWEEKIAEWLLNAFEPYVSEFVTIEPNSMPFIIKISEEKQKPYCYKEKRVFDHNNIYVWNFFCQ